MEIMYGYKVDPLVDLAAMFLASVLKRGIHPPGTLIFNMFSGGVTTSLCGRAPCDPSRPKCLVNSWNGFVDGNCEFYTLTRHNQEKLQK